MDYLRGRGGKIKELEDELANAKSRCGKLEQEAREHAEAIAQLQAENKASVALKAAALAPASGPGSSAVEHLNRQLDEQLRRALALEQDLASAKQREAVTAQRLSSLQAAADQARVEQAGALAAAGAEAARLRAELEAARADAALAVQRAELAQRVAQRRVEAEQEVLKVTQAQLEELRGAAGALRRELEAAQGAAAAREAEAAALRGSSQVVRLQLLEGELRGAREALARAQAAQGAAAAAGARAGAGAQAGTSPGAQAAAAAAQRGPGPAAGGSAQGAGPSAGRAAAPEAVLPEALRGPWEALCRALAVPPGLSLALAAEEAARAAGALGREAAELRSALSAREEELMQQRAVSSGSEAYAAELQSQLAAARSRLERALTGEKVAERRAAAIEAERDCLRSALQSPTAAAGVANPASLPGQLLAGQRVAALTAEVASSLAAAEAQALAAAAATARAEAADTRIKSLERAADSLAAEERLGRGELIRAGGLRVLHLRHNPEAEARAEEREAATTRLAAENEALRAHVGELEAAAAGLRAALEAAQGSGGAAPPPPPADSSAPSASPPAVPAPALGGGVSLAVKDAEIVVLRRRLEETDKAMSRLKAVFKERITVFREACYSLFGYRVDMTAEATAAADAAGAPTTFTLKPQHADDPSVLLIFRYSGGHMELVPTTFTRERLAREVGTFVTKFNCIPALTANLTMDNFQKQTQC
ncbi:hypothetical protein HYH03_012420 [Edaphochlamys debaryana]|uniref:Mitotic checkpoint protein MAD1 n=1 Tax=Edaphochlamys debaryana TaxID=47281 RepID=A0A836BVG5_9CHLO|nr:hypothetical protein HYH03_012420 [Edaphochlamys debaryana]|eukprot:KAG2488979.1 hypothetical protein HYH03_012420 [Edaphochlamys debaryana]